MFSLCSCSSTYVLLPFHIYFRSLLNLLAIVLLKSPRAVISHCLESRDGLLLQSKPRSWHSSLNGMVCVYLAHFPLLLWSTPFQTQSSLVVLEHTEWSCFGPKGSYHRFLQGLFLDFPEVFIQTYFINVLSVFLFNLLGKETKELCPF